MDIVDCLDEPASRGRGVVLASGVFDGVHLGHQAVFAEARALAERLGALPVALTFEPHPAAVLRPEKAPKLIVSRQHKRRLIAGQGMAALVELPFTQQFAALPAMEFVRNVHDSLRGRLAGWCAGEAWTFGKGRSGTMSLLAEISTGLGFHVRPVPAVLVQGQPASSTRIRQALAVGDLALAAACLGRPFSILGKVTKGRQLGRTLGFPTANLPLEAWRELPPFGVYAGRVRLPGGHAVASASHQPVSICGPAQGGKECSALRDGVPAVINLGKRPTVNDAAPEPLLEAHLLDWSGDLYGLEIEVELLTLLRPEQKFPNLDALRTQIARDASTARALLKSPRHLPP